MAVIALKAAADIRKDIKSIAQRGAKLDASIQSAGLQCIWHADTHGDTTLLDELFSAMPKGSRRVMLAEWAVAFGTVSALSAKIAEDKQRIQNGAHFKLDRTKRLDLEAAEATHWYDMRKQETAAQAFDAKKAIGQLIGRINKAGANAINLDEAEDAIRDLLDALHAAQEARQEESAEAFEPAEEETNLLAVRLATVAPALPA